jgi:autotransporter-associated beta strand protein
VADWNKLDNILAWNNTGSWLEGNTPASANTTRIIYGPNLTVARNSTLGAVLTAGQFNYNLNTVTTSTIGTGTTTLFTLAPAANFGSIGILVNAGRVAFASPIALSDSQTWQVDSGALLTLTGGSTGLITGSLKNLTKTGAGQLTLSPANASTFTGSVFANEGIIVV